MLSINRSAHWGGQQDRDSCYVSCKKILALSDKNDC